MRSAKDLAFAAHERDFAARNSRLMTVFSPDPLKPLKNQKALVTGASSGIGEACALALGAAGADVVVNYRSDAEEDARVGGRIEQSGSRAIAIRADVSREDEVRAMFLEMAKEFGTIDIL